jgi:hypothetical protein
MSFKTSNPSGKNRGRPLVLQFRSDAAVEKFRKAHPGKPGLPALRFAYIRIAWLGCLCLSGDSINPDRINASPRREIDKWRLTK